MYLSIYLSIYLSLYLSLYLAIYLSIYLSIYISLSLSLSPSLSLSLLRSFFGPICLFSEKRVTAGTSSLPAVICSVFWRSFGAIVESFGCLLRSFGSKKTKKNNRRHQLLFGTLFWEGLNVLESPNIPPSTEMGSKTRPKIYLQSDIWLSCLPVKSQTKYGDYYVINPHISPVFS